MLTSGILEARALTKTYGAHVALQNVSFAVAQGEVAGLLGLNGAGKTTTLRLLCGLMHPTSGSVVIGGRQMADEPEATRSLLGFLPETPPLYPEMTVRGYLAFAARLRGVHTALDSALDVALSATDLLGVQHTPIGALSHGTQRRVGIAQAVVHRPAVVLLDEPTHGLDPLQVVHMRKLIRSLKGRHTILVSSHLLTEISALCDRLLVLDDGRLLADGTEAELAQGQTARMTVALEVRGSAEQLTHALANLDAIEDSRIESESDGVTRMTAELRRDARAELARLILSHELELLGLERRRLALENIFMQLMGQHEQPGEAASGAAAHLPAADAQAAPPTPPTAAPAAAATPAADTSVDVSEDGGL